MPNRKPMRAEIESTKVCSREILHYLFVPLLAAVIIATISHFFWPGASEWKVGTFALLVVLWSVFFSRVTGNTLPTGPVDFWYYGLGILGVLLFFMASDLQRQKLTLQADYQKARESIPHYENFIQLFKEVTGDRDAYHKRIVEIAEREAQALPVIPSVADRESSLPLKCTEFLIGPLRPTPEELTMFNPSKPWSGQPAIPKLYDPEFICDPRVEQSARQLREKNRELARQWTEIANTVDLTNAVQLIDRYKLDDRIAVRGVGGIAARFADVKDYLILIPGTTEWQSKSDELEDYKKKAEDDMGMIAKKYEKIGGSIEDSLSQTQPNFFFLFGWPYVLIMALGMKLARRSYKFGE